MTSTVCHRVLSQNEFWHAALIGRKKLLQKHENALDLIFLILEIKNMQIQGSFMIRVIDSAAGNTNPKREFLQSIEKGIPYSLIVTESVISGLQS